MPKILDRGGGSLTEVDAISCQTPQACTLLLTSDLDLLKLQFHRAQCRAEGRKLEREMQDLVREKCLQLEVININKKINK